MLLKETGSWKPYGKNRKYEGKMERLRNMPFTELWSLSVILLQASRNGGKHPGFKVQENWLQVWKLWLTSYETPANFPPPSLSNFFPLGDLSVVLFFRLVVWVTRVNKCMFQLSIAAWETTPKSKTTELSWAVFFFHVVSDKVMHVAVFCWQFS